MILIYCTCPKTELADHIARCLVEERLAACVNRISGVVSTYRWQEKIETEQECLLLIKSTRERFDALKHRIQELHSYELPEIIAVEVVAGLDRYLNWVVEETHPQSK